MTTATEKTTAPATPKRREWAPRIWEGCDFIGWIKLLARNRFAVDWSYLYIPVIVTFVSIFHSLLRVAQNACYGRQIAGTERT